MRLSSAKTDSSLPFYPDNGCEVYEECLSCPLPKCIHDEALVSQMNRARNARIRMLHFDHGMKMIDIARKTGLDRKTISQVITKEGRGKRYSEGDEEYLAVNWVNFI